MGKKQPVTTKRSDEITQKYFEFLDKHIEDVIAGRASDFMEINRVAAQLALSHQHLTDSVRAATGFHPCHFYDQKILEQAKHMLLQTDESVATIARTLTYDPSNFSKFFKKLTGQTPGQFRKEAKH